LLPYLAYECQTETQIRDYDAEEVFELLIYHEQNLKLLSKFRSKAHVKILRKLELEPQEITVAVLKLTEGLGLTEEMASRCLRTLGGRSGERHQLDKEL
jgi:hypothetical protein